jgi:hypothetical protein
MMTKSTGFFGSQAWAGPATRTAIALKSATSGNTTLRLIMIPLL